MRRNGGRAERSERCQGVEIGNDIGKCNQEFNRSNIQDVVGAVVQKSYSELL